MATDYLQLSKDAFDASTSYVDANLRADWDYSLRAFRSEHAPGSKYLSEEYKHRSRLFPAKTRSVIRKNEAAAMQAAFSNRELVQVEAGNPDDVMSVASGAAMKEILDYRLTKTIPTFEIYLGGVQDAQTTGTVCSYQYWEYEKKADGTKRKDRPCIELRPIENIRLDAGANWLDPVGSSPYFCDIVPMYVCDVRAMMKNIDDKTGKPKWKSLDDKTIAQARPIDFDTTRKARLGGQQDPHTETSSISSFDTVWVMRWFMKDSQGEDMAYYTLGTVDLLCEARPIDEVYFHGKRPYVIGYSILETHRALKTSMPTLIKPLQQETADIRNQRLDNVKFVLNKRWIVARGRQVDVQSLVRNVPGGVTLATDPKNDVQESNWPDVTSSSFVEHDRLNAETDDLAGNFSPSTRVANNAVNDTLGGSRMASAGAGLMSEYLLRTINETWWEKVMRQLVLLEQYYESDEIVLAVCANKAKLFPRFGISNITDMMLMAEVNVTVDMAMGDPNQRLQKFLFVIKAAIELIQTAPPSVKIQEVIKEMFANAGYRDGARFIGETDPRLPKLMQALQQMKGQLEGKQMELQAGMQETQLKLTSNEKIKGAELQVDAERIGGDLRIREAELQIETQKLEVEKLKLQIQMRGSDQEMQMRAVELQTDIDAAQVKLQGEREKQAAESQKSQMEVQKAALELQRTQAEAANESRITEVAEKVGKHVDGSASEMAAMRDGVMQAHQHVAGVKADVAELNKGMSAMAQMMMVPKRKPKGFKLIKADGKKTSGVSVEYDDGSIEDMAVQ